MSCNSCAKSFSLLRKEKGCPSCGFSYCSKCLNDKIFVKKLNAEAKVCAKCKKTANAPQQQQIVEPPEAYYKRLGATGDLTQINNMAGTSGNNEDQQIQERLKRLKEDRVDSPKRSTDEEIAKRLENIKGETPKTSDAELYARLAKLRGIPEDVLKSKPVLPAPDHRTEQEQADDLLKQYMEQTKIDSKYKDEFDQLVSDMESRVNKLKGSPGDIAVANAAPAEEKVSEDEEETVKKIIEKIKVEATLEDNDVAPSTNDELPFCEICNEDARMRCLGCKYLFCKRCFLDHKDDDDGCDRYESYDPPKGYQY